MAAIPLARLAEADFAMFARRSSPVYFDRVTAACYAAGFAPRIVHEVRAVTSQIAFVACGQGVALVPLRFKGFAPPGVVIRPLAEPIEIVAAALVWSEARPNPLVEVTIALFTGLGR